MPSPNNYTSFYDLLKPMFDEEQMNVLINTETPTWGRIKKNDNKVVKPSGQGWVFAVRFDNNQAVRSFGQSAGPLPAPVGSGGVTGKVQWVRTMQSISFDKILPYVASNREEAFVEFLSGELKQSLDAFNVEIARQLGSGNGSGVITTVTVGATSATQTVADAVYFQRGMKVDLYSSANVLKTAGLVVSSFDFVNNTVTFTASVTTTAGDYFVRSGITPNAGMEMMGIPGIAGDATDVAVFEGISRATYPMWNAFVKDAGGTSITLSTIQLMDDIASIGRGVSNNKVLWCRHGQRRRLAELALPHIEYSGGSKKTDLGVDTETMTVNGKEVLVDRYAPLGTVVCLDLDKIIRFELVPLGLASGPEGQQWARVPDYDELSGYFIYAGNFGTKEPSGFWKVKNLSEPGYV